MFTSISRIAGAVLAVLFLALVPLSAATLQPAAHSHNVAWWLAGTALLFGTSSVVTAIRTPNQPIPINSYAANVVVLDGDASPSLIPLPAALQAKMVALTMTDATLIFTLVVNVIGAATAGLALHYNASTGNLELAHATGSTTGCTVNVSVRIPTTDNAP